ncbi:hypothetical protein, partial [Bacteroides acidifaciens]|uniref:hypothetical protein n=1 Tax=Bacteroides acidifaciens TaxID=85831 RepID=UPI0026F03247
GGCTVTRFSGGDVAGHGYSPDFRGRKDCDDPGTEIHAWCQHPQHQACRYQCSCTCADGGGFAGPKWSVRVSLANLNENDYVRIGQSIKRVLEEYAETWKASVS